MEKVKMWTRLAMNSHLTTNSLQLRNLTNTFNRTILWKGLPHITSTYLFYHRLREAAVRTIIDASQYVTSYSEFELILEIVYALSSDHGKIL